MAGPIEGNPPYTSQETITYTCAQGYVLLGTARNTCLGPPSFAWETTGDDLPQCLQG